MGRGSFSNQVVGSLDRSIRPGFSRTSCSKKKLDVKPEKEVQRWSKEIIECEQSDTIHMEPLGKTWALSYIEQIKLKKLKVTPNYNLPAQKILPDGKLLFLAGAYMKIFSSV